MNHNWSLFWSTLRMRTVWRHYKKEGVEKGTLFRCLAYFPFTKIKKDIIIKTLLICCCLLPTLSSFLSKTKCTRLMAHHLQDCHLYVGTFFYLWRLLFHALVPNWTCKYSNWLISETVWRLRHKTHFAFLCITYHGFFQAKLNKNAAKRNG